MQILTINTPKSKCVVDITKIVNDLLNKNFYDKGIVHINLLHTSCALACADFDPGAEDDYLNGYLEMVPKLNYNHPHNPSHFPDHLLSSIIGTFFTLPVQSATMFLGQWQKLILVEFNGPKERRISVTFIPEPIIT